MAENGARFLFNVIGFEMHCVFFFFLETDLLSLLGFA